MDHILKTPKRLFRLAVSGRKTGIHFCWNRCDAARVEPRAGCDSIDQSRFLRHLFAVSGAIATILMSPDPSAVCGASVPRTGWTGMSGVFGPGMWTPGHLEIPTVFCIL